VSSESSAQKHRLRDVDLAREIEFLLARARAIGTAHANEGLADFELKARSYAVLSLACSASKPTQRELAEFLSLDASQIVALVDALQNRDLVRREPDASDRRSNVIVGTEAGRTLYVRAARVVADAEADSLAALTAAERNQLRELLSKVAF
jgi:DNA-binding MarR family transcriptional regulator